MISTLVYDMLALREEGAEVAVEVVGAKAVFDEAAYKTLKTLQAQEQILVTLFAVGFEDVVDTALEAMGIKLSADAAAMMLTTQAAQALMSQEERDALRAAIEENFPRLQAEVDGVLCEYFIVNVEIVVDGVKRTESYGFRFDETTNQWIFVKMDTLI